MICCLQSIEWVTHSLWSNVLPWRRWGTDEEANILYTYIVDTSCTKNYESQTTVTKAERVKICDFNKIEAIGRNSEIARMGYFYQKSCINIDVYFSVKYLPKTVQ